MGKIRCSLSVYSKPFHLAIPSITSPSAVSVSSPPGAAAMLAAKLDGQKLGRFRLKVTAIRPVRPRVGWLYVDMALAEGQEVSSSPFVTAIVSGGGRGVRQWVECRIFPQVEFPQRGSIDARRMGLEAGVIRRLGALIPRGGHLMIDYDSGGQDLTLAELVAQVPPTACYLGELMFRAGFRGQFKDWYFSEGGHEGPRKLQANKSPTSEAERAAIRDHMRVLRQFVRRPLARVGAPSEIIANAVARARGLIRDFGASMRG
jgi:hypothetical protein